MPKTPLGHPSNRYIVYNATENKLMSEEECATAMIGVLANGQIASLTGLKGAFRVLHHSGMFDSLDAPLYDGDVCDVAIPNPFGSVQKTRAVVRWIPEETRYVLIRNSDSEEIHPVESIIRIGNEWADPSLIETL